MKDWEEGSNGFGPKTNRSLDPILDSGSDSDTQPDEGGFRKVLKKMGVKDSHGGQDDMTITMTSEVELQIEPASSHYTRQNSRQESPRAHEQGRRERSSSRGQQWA
jgi:hypothetical protein